MEASRPPRRRCRPPGFRRPQEPARMRPEVRGLPTPVPYPYRPAKRWAWARRRGPRTWPPTPGRFASCPSSPPKTSAGNRRRRCLPARLKSPGRPPSRRPSPMAKSSSKHLGHNQRKPLSTRGMSRRRIRLCGRAPKGWGSAPWGSAHPMLQGGCRWPTAQSSPNLPVPGRPGCRAGQKCPGLGLRSRWHRTFPNSQSPKNPP